MQTFLPLPSFTESAYILDYKRLGKQRIEARTILEQLKYGGGWVNHPAVKMWRGYEDALVRYGDCIIREWKRRGYKNNMSIYDPFEVQGIEMPWWFGDERFHASHRSNLLRKFPEHYSQFGWTEKPDVPYFWPVEKEKV